MMFAKELNRSNYAVDEVDDDDVADEEAEEINREALEQDAAQV